MKEVKGIDIGKTPGTYRGVDYKISSWTDRFGQSLSYYLFLNSEDFKDAGYLMHKISNEDLSVGGGITNSVVISDSNLTGIQDLSSLAWHGEMSFLSVDVLDNGSLSLAVGTDYQNMFDEGMLYTKESVIEEIHGTIDSLDEAFPDLLPSKENDSHAVLSIVR